MHDLIYFPDIVSKDDLLINANFKFSLLTNKMFAYSLASIRENPTKNEKGSLYVSIQVKTIAKNLGISPDDTNIYKSLKKSAIELTDARVYIEHEDGFMFQNIASNCTAARGEFKLTFCPEMEDYILHLSNNTSLNFAVLSNCETTSQFRLYELLKSRCKDNVICTTELSVSELMIRMGAVDVNDVFLAPLFQTKNIDYDKILNKCVEKHESDVKKGVSDPYPLPKWNGDYSRFRKEIIKPSVEKLNEIENCDIEIVGVEPVRVNKKIKSIKFTVKAKNSNVVIDKPKKMSEEEKLNLIDQARDLISVKISSIEIKAILEACNYNLEVFKEKYEVTINSNYNDFTKFMIAAIKGDYKASSKVSNKKKNSFIDFEQRQNDFDAIEEAWLKKSKKIN